MAQVKQDLLINIKLNTAEFTKGTKEVEKSFEGIETQIEETEGASKNLKTELREVKKALLTIDPDSAKFKELRERAGQLTEQIGDVNEVVKNLAQDGFERNLAAGVGAIELAAGGFGLVQSSLNILGIESDIVNTSLEKLAATTTLLNSINSIKQALDEKSALSLFLQSKGITAASVSQKAKNIVDTAAIGIQKLLQKGIGVTSLSLKGLRAAIISTGIGALVVGIGALIANFDKLASALGFAGDEAKELSERQKRIADNTAEAEKELAKESVQALNLFNQLKKTNAGSKERKELIDKINGTYGTTLKNLKNEEEFLNAVAKAQLEVIKGIEAKVKSRIVEAELEALLLKQRETEKKLDEDDRRVLEINTELRGKITNQRRQELEIERAIIQTRQAQRQLQEVEATDILTGEINNVIGAKKQLVEQYESESNEINILLNELAKLQSAQAQNTEGTKKDTEKRKSTLDELFKFQIDVLQKTEDATIQSLADLEQAEIDKLNLDKEREAKALQDNLNNIKAETAQEIEAKALAQELLNAFLLQSEEERLSKILDIKQKYIDIEEQQRIENENKRLDSETNFLLAEQSNRKVIIEQTIEDENKKQLAILEIELETNKKLLDILKERALLDKIITDEETVDINNKILEIEALLDGIKEKKKEIAEQPLISPETKEQFEVALEVITSAVNNLSDILNAAFENQKAQIEEETKTRIKGIEDSVLTEKQKARQIEKIEKEQARKTYELELQAFEFNKGIQIAQTIINTAGAVVAALNNPTPFVGPVLAALAAATGAVQVGIIAAQPPPPKPFYEGGYTGDGNIREESRALGRKDYIYHKGEYVVPNKILRTQQGSQLVSALEGMRIGTRTSLGLTGFADGGFTASQISDRVNSQLQAEQISSIVTNAISNVQIVTKVTDINRVNNNLAQVKIKSTMR